MISFPARRLRNAFLLTAAVLVGRLDGLAASAPLVCTPDVQHASAASETLFREVMDAPTGIGMTDEALYPKALNRQVVKITVLSAYNGSNIGIEHWTVAHDENDSVIYLVRLVSDKKGGTSIAVGRDIAAETELAQPAPMSRDDPSGPKNLRFEGDTYYRHWGQNSRQLFTPKGQDDLASATDFFIVGFYPNVTDAAGLADLANKMVARYKDVGAFVLAARPIAATESHPGECFISVVAPEKGTMIAEFARYQIIDGICTVIAYQHRIHGPTASAEMSTWIKANGGKKEDDVLNWEPNRPLATFRN